MAKDESNQGSTADIQKHLNQLIDADGSSGNQTSTADEKKRKQKPKKKPKPSQRPQAKEQTTTKRNWFQKQQKQRAARKLKAQQASAELTDEIVDEMPAEIPDNDALEEASIPTPQGIGTFTKARWQGITVILVLLGLVIILGWLISPLAQVQKYQVVGNDDLSDARVLQAAQLKEKQSTFLTFEERHYFEKKAQQADPQIDQLTLSIKNPTTLQVKVKEHPKVGYVKSAAGYQALLEDGRVIGQTTKQRPTSTYAVYDHFPSDQVALKKVSGQVGKLNGPIRRSISDIVWSPTKLNQDRLILFMNDGNEVLISASDLSKKMAYYPAIAAQVAHQKQNHAKKKTIIDLQVGAYGYQQNF